MYIEWFHVQSGSGSVITVFVGCFMVLVVVTTSSEVVNGRERRVHYGGS